MVRRWVSEWFLLHLLRSGCVGCGLLRGDTVISIRGPREQILRAAHSRAVAGAGGRCAGPHRVARPQSARQTTPGVSLSLLFYTFVSTLFSVVCVSVTVVVEFPFFLTRYGFRPVCGLSDSVSVNRVLVYTIESKALQRPQMPHVESMRTHIRRDEKTEEATSPTCNSTRRDRTPHRCDMRCEVSVISCAL